jgi:prepilin-type N-terminal cleavage/methylation domain-containing protein
MMQLRQHSTSPAHRNRLGFTLVELMIVVAIIGVIVTLVASASMQVISRQKSANTEATIQKVHNALNAHWQAVFRQAQTEPIPPNILYGDRTMLGLIAMAGGNADPDSMRRARVIWINLRLKQEFPMNFLEALVPTPNMVSNGLPVVLLPPDPVFVQALVGRPTLPWPVGQIPTLLPAGSGLSQSSVAGPNHLPQSFESSVCLLLALSQGSQGVVALDQDRLAATERLDSGPNGLKAIADAWGRSLTFYRWPIGGELATTNPNLTDLLDQDGLLMSPHWNNPQAYQKRQGVWAFEKLLHPVRDVDAGSYKPRSYYSVPVIASAGPTAGTPSQAYLSIYDLMGLPPPQQYPPAPAVGLPPALLHDPMKMANGKSDSLDNIYSFRMRLGARGD